MLKKSNSFKVISRLNHDNVNLEYKKEALNKIKEYFEDPSKYLEIDHNIIVNKKLSGPKYDHNNKIIPRTVVGDPKLIEKGLQNYLDIKTENKRKTNHNNRIISQNNKTRNFEIADDDKLNEIYSKAKERIIYSAKNDYKNGFKNEYKNGFKNEYKNENNFNIEIKENLFKQEKHLFNRENLKSAKIFERISQKLKRKDEDLLMNRTDGFRIKKQINDIIDSKIPLDRKYGDNSWVLSLRRDKNPKFVRVNYLNVGSNEFPKWKHLIEYPPKPIEIINRPNTSSYKEMKYLMKNKYFNDALKEAEINIENMKGLGKLSIKGENLLNVEMKRAKSSMGNKRIFNYEGEILMKSEIFKMNY